MGCTGCSVAIENGKPSGCGSKGNCSTGGCNRMNTFDWLTQMDIANLDGYHVAEISFKNGSRKGFFKLKPQLGLTTGETVVVEASSGFDIGKISLSGELVRLQMKRKKVKEDSILHGVIRRANERDLERLYEARSLEKQTLIRARAIARTLDLDMKMGDVEFQGDKRKATFFYTANGRVDFRELIRHYAKEFRVKIEMRQIGARQESARIGGLGSCGRELCCSTWLTDFKSVSTAAARYQNLAINQAKLSGQCGRLKCCLNFELDTYMEAIQVFPKKADKLQTQAGLATLVKTDIFKQLMFYTYPDGKNRGKLYPLKVDQVKEVQEMNKKGEKPVELGILSRAYAVDVDDEPDYEDVTGVIELPPEERKKKRRNNRRKKKSGGGGNNQQGRGKQGQGGKKQEKAGKKEDGQQQSKSSRRRRGNRNKGKQEGGQNQNAQPKTQQQNQAKAEGGQPKAEGDNKGKSNRNRNRNRRRNKNRRKGGGDGQGNNSQSTNSDKDA